jgi:MOSC domain-containing protein YiiM
MGEVTAISVADRRGIKKKNVECAELKENYGIIGDAHAGDWHRQVSLLTEESMDTVRQKGLNVRPGDFAENICVKGVHLLEAKIGTKEEYNPWPQRRAL